MIPTETLKRLFRIDRDTGRLYWLPREPEMFRDGKYPAARLCSMWNAHYAGKEALTSPIGPYRSGRIFGRHYLAHVIVFAIDNGRWPTDNVDHRDNDGGNNRPDNLREATRQQNMRNSGSRGGTSQYCGVVWHKGGRKWMAYCTDGSGKRRHLGMFVNEVDAARAYDAAAREWHGEFARLNLPDDAVVQAIRTYQDFKGQAAA